MTWVLAYNRTDSAVVVDGAGRFAWPRDFTYAESTDPVYRAAWSAGDIITVPISFNPSGSPAGLDPEAYEAAQVVVLRNGGTWVPPDPPAQVMSLEQLSAAVAELQAGGGGGGVSAESVRTIMADTLVPGPGIDIAPVDDKLEVASRVTATTVVRPWAPAELLYATQFEGGVPEWASVSSIATSGGGSQPVTMSSVILATSAIAAVKPAYDTGLLVTTNTTTTNTTTIATLALGAIPALAGKAPTRIKGTLSWQRGSTATAPTGTVLTGAVARRNDAALASASSATPFEAFDYSLSTGQTDLILRLAKGGNSVAHAQTGYVLTGLEVYGVPEPWMFGEVAAYQGQLWQSLQDNNPYTPGSGQGWSQL